MAGLDEETIDDILYLARTNESAELASYLSDVAARTKQSQTELLAAAVDPYSKNGALHYAAANGHNDVIKLLFASSSEKPSPVLINALNDAGNTPLHWAALNGHLDSVKLLVESGADVTVINRAGHDAVFEAEINDKKEVVDWLLGAVEELENGIGHTGEASDEQSADNIIDHTEQDQPVGDDGKMHSGREAASSVEDVRKQMEDMGTTDSAPQDG